MLTLEQVREYLASVGIVVPDFILTIWLSQINEIDECLIAAGYPVGTQTLIKLYLLGLFGLAAGDKYVSSQSAPSGASQSFRYQQLSDRWRATSGLLRSLDKSGCTNDLVPPDPTQRNYAGLWTAKGGCHE